MGSPSHKGTRYTGIHCTGAPPTNIPCYSSCVYVCVRACIYVYLPGPDSRETRCAGITMVRASWILPARAMKNIILLLLSPFGGWQVCEDAARRRNEKKSHFHGKTRDPWNSFGSGKNRRSMSREQSVYLSPSPCVCIIRHKRTRAYVYVCVYTTELITDLICVQGTH